MLKDNRKITGYELTSILNASISTVNRDLNWLRKNKRIEYVGSSKNGKWVVKE